MFEQISILGTGLLGASLAMAIKERGISQRTVVWSRSAGTRDRCRQADWCDLVCPEAKDAVAGSDLVVICAPVKAIVPLLNTIATSLEENVLVTDVGSTKQNICLNAEPILKANQTFIGSHPMAGSEQSGMLHAHAKLFESAACILTPTPGVPSEKTTRLHNFWEAMGMITHEMSPQQHDEIVAHISHLPHLLATTLCNSLAKKSPSWATLAGGGLRDTTRIAAGDPVLWQQILSDNRDAVLLALQGFEEELAIIRNILGAEEDCALEDALDTGKSYRDKLRS